jgi:hypothetical protein
MRGCVRELSSRSHLDLECGTQHESGHGWKIIALPGTKARDLARTCPSPGQAAGCPLRRLRSAIPCLRDGLRSSRSTSQDVRGYPHGGPRGRGSDLGRGCQVRYRLRQLSPRPDSGQAREFDAGVAQLAERDPSKVDVAGSIPVSRSTDLPTVRWTDWQPPRRGPRGPSRPPPRLSAPRPAPRLRQTWPDRAARGSWRAFDRSPRQDRAAS